MTRAMKGWVAVVVMGVAVGASEVIAQAQAPWCSGATDPAKGTNFGACAAAAAAPAAAPSLYKRLGGREGIALVVSDFVAAMAADPRVNTRFKNLKPADLEKLKTNIADQICDATGGPCSYVGRDMKAVHKGMKVTDAQWSAAVDDLGQALDKHRIGAKEKQELVGVLTPMKGDIVGQ